MDFISGSCPVAGRVLQAQIMAYHQAFSSDHCALLAHIALHSPLGSHTNPWRVACCVENPVVWWQLHQ